MSVPSFLPETLPECFIRFYPLLCLSFPMTKLIYGRDLTFLSQNEVQSNGENIFGATFVEGIECHVEESAESELNKKTKTNKQTNKGPI